MCKFIYFDKDTAPIYPCNLYYIDSIEYITEVANIINKTFPHGDIAIICRGASGCILSSAVALKLYEIRENKNIKIYISRKEYEGSHSCSLEGLDMINPDNTHIIVIDDFLETGNTLKSILEDVGKMLGINQKLDMLCISNIITENYWNKVKNGEYSSTEDIMYKDIFSHFNYIVCNKHC